MGKQDAATLGKQVSCVGKFILPGYIDTHVHFFQSGDLSRAGRCRFNSVRPYKDEVGGSNRTSDDVFVRYIRAAITSVVDVGGPMWNSRSARKPTQRPKSAARSRGGPLISSVSREKLDLAIHQSWKIDTTD